MKKAQGALFGTIIAVVIGVIMLSLIWSLQTSAINYDTATDTVTYADAAINITLTQDNLISLTSVTNASSTTVAAANYTYNSTEKFVELVANLSGTYGNGTYTATYKYQQVGYITSPITRLVVGFIAVLLAVGLLVFAIKGKSD